MRWYGRCDERRSFEKKKTWPGESDVWTEREMGYIVRKVRVERIVLRIRVACNTSTSRMQFFVFRFKTGDMIFRHILCWEGAAEYRSSVIYIRPMNTPVPAITHTQKKKLGGSLLSLN